jgi:predicted transcriptional regulator of viral defense system
LATAKRTCQITATSMHYATILPQSNTLYLFIPKWLFIHERVNLNESYYNSNLTLYPLGNLVPITVFTAAITDHQKKRVNTGTAG